ncbi:4'-phosphopantetheinyl transferase family protein [Glycomyces harbinensis]|uniref:4'-phosphopantetheinyl transferase n=1 Tax=Glycomyces harbinensis TaxID=58114 RepID=A0A1G6ZJM6_9ACTN|nr:4'-phosphopantetheinyl transferase superfamily protein [Glycomyces harbinensis]SDE02632.1 4'-phosphopantetheinyl transferase [Glycomyces harbinensis]
MDTGVTVHVWVVPPVEGRGERERLLAVLDRTERERLARFAYAHTRMQYLTAHALLRCALSAMTDGVGAAEWRFTAAPGGKPAIAAPASRLRFNLSHTDGAVACAIADGTECGIDIESATAVGDDIGQFAFTADERARIAQAPKDSQRTLRTALWTLKEAYGKATGEGLTARVRATTLHPAPTRLPEPWRHLRFTAGRHTVALVCAPDRRRLRCRLHQAFPTPRTTGRPH